MAERVDVSRLSVAECMALGGGAGEPTKEEGLQGKLEKLVQEIGLEVEGVDRHLHTGLEDPERSGGGALCMVTTVKDDMGCAKSDYLWNHTFKSPVTRTDTRS